MSEIKVNSIKGVGASAAAITVNNTDGTCTANITNNLSNRNKIINGSMICSQRGSSFANANSYTLDRWRYYKNISGEVTVSQENITDLVGFGKALKINTTTAQAGIPSTSGKQYASIFQAIEAQDLQDLANGASGAKTITLSFWIKSNVTGTFCVSFYKADNTQRLISLPYTINSSNTWEKKTLVVPGDTSGGGIDNDNGNGLSLYWVWARKTGYSGTTSTSWVDYSDAAWANTCTGTIFENVNDHVFITGVQLEVDHTGSGVATDFEHRSFAQELALCQRYFQRVNGCLVGVGASSTSIRANYQPIVNFRASPTITGNAAVTFVNPGVNAPTQSSFDCGIQHTYTPNNVGINLGFGNFSNANQGYAYLQWDADDEYINFDAEL